MKAPTPLSTDIDYLVYSSHKTGTQSLVATLKASSLRARHIHVLGNAGMRSGDESFKRFTEGVRHETNEKLTILTTFRLPVERHISSFFQWHGDGVVRMGKCACAEETIIYKDSIEELRRVFIEEVKSQSLIGREESLHEIANELDLEASRLTYNPTEGYGVLDVENARIILFRFDNLFHQFPHIPARAIGKNLTPAARNISKQKWYNNTMEEFQRELRMPAQLIREAFYLRKDLIDIFYPSQYDQLLEIDLNRYGRHQ
jgi:hypothetical protein